MGTLTSADANDMLDSRFGAGLHGASNAPATYYLALSTTTPDTEGNNFTEPTDPSYARVAMTNDTTVFLAAQGRSKTTATAVTFPTASTDWGMCTHFALYDVATGGLPRAWGELINAQDVAAGIAPSFPAGGIVISVS